MCTAFSHDTGVEVRVFHHADFRIESADMLDALAAQYSGAADEHRHIEQRPARECQFCAERPARASGPLGAAGHRAGTRALRRTVIEKIEHRHG